MDKKIVRSNCKLCGLRCKVFLHIHNGRITEIKADAGSGPFDNAADICPRFRGCLEFFHHPKRLKHPLKRVGGRGEGKWRRIRWDQALDEIAQKLEELKEKYGAEALATCKGSPKTTYWPMFRFLNLFGSQTNLDIGHVCWTQNTLVQITSYGGYSIPLISENTRCWVICGSNPAESKPPVWNKVLTLKKKGAMLIVIDPRLTKTARHADIWLPIRPGTDGALLLCWLNIIITEGLYDRDFVEKWTNAPFLVRLDTMELLRQADMVENGSKKKFMIWDIKTNRAHTYNPGKQECEPKRARPAITGIYELSLADRTKVKCKTVWTLLKERIEEYLPRKVEEITWISADKIRESARMYASNSPGVFFHGFAMDQIGRNSTQTARSECILRSITGSVDVKGGDFISRPPRFVSEKELELNEMFPPEFKIKQIGSDHFKLITWTGYTLLSKYSKNLGQSLPTGYFCCAHPPKVWRAIITGEPYPVKALIVVASNPLLSFANSRLVYNALKQLDLLVVLDFFMTPTAMLADYVFPAASGFERSQLVTYGGIVDYAYGGPKGIEPLFERRTDFQFWRDLGIKLGQEEYWPWKTLEEAYDYRFSPVGMTWDDFCNAGVYLPEIEYRKYTKIDPKTNNPVGFGTPSGKVELYSTIFKELGYDPLPYYEEPAESPYSTPKLAEEYPLILTTGSRFQPYFNSEFRQVKSLRKLHPHPIMQIHPETASKLGIKEGDWVYIKTPRGAVKQKVELFTGIHPRVVHAQHGWWFPEKPSKEPSLGGVWESNINVVTDDDPENCDPSSGGWSLRALLCKVSKV